jgi:hypothetical protein
MKKSGKTEIKWEDLPRATREITSFFHLIIEETIELMNVEFTPTYIRCFKKNHYQYLFYKKINLF